MTHRGQAKCGSDICAVLTLMLVLLVSSPACGGEKQWEPIRRIKAPSAVHSLAASPVGNLVAVGCEKGEILLLDPQKGELRPFVRSPDGGDISLLAFTPDGKYVVSYLPDWQIGFWELVTRKQSKRLALPPTSQAEGHWPVIAFSPDGSLLGVSSSKQGNIEIWEVGNESKGFRRIVIPGVKDALNQSVVSLAFSRSSRLIVSSHEPAEMRVREVVSGRALYTLKFESEVPWHPHRAMGAISPDGWSLAWIREKMDKKISIGNKAEPALYNLATGKEICVFNGKHSCRSVTFSHSGRYLLYGGFDLWDLSTKGKKERTSPEKNYPGFAAFTADRKYMVTPDSENAIDVWKVDDSVDVRTVLPKSAAGADIRLLMSLLRHEDPGQAYRAIWQLAGEPSVLGLIKTEIDIFKTNLQKHRERVTYLVPRLGSENFTVRESATIELTEILSNSSSLAKYATSLSSSPESTRRIEAILARIKQPGVDVLWRERTLELLELIGTPEARRLVSDMATGFPTEFSAPAKKTLARLSKISLHP